MIFNSPGNTHFWGVENFVKTLFSMSSEYIITQQYKYGLAAFWLFVYKMGGPFLISITEKHFYLHHHQNPSVSVCN